jgi:hypothetical protein
LPERRALRGSGAALSADAEGADGLSSAPTCEPDCTLPGFSVVVALRC